MNVGEYNIRSGKRKYKEKNNCFFVFVCTIIFEMQEKGHNVLFQHTHNLDFGHLMAAVYVQSFRLIQ
jgi:hypothetical protein